MRRFPLTDSRTVGQFRVVLYYVIGSAAGRPAAFKHIMNKDFNGQIIQQDARDCQNYYNHEHCLLATALRRMVPRARVIEVYPKCFQIDGNFYSISPQLNSAIFHTYQKIKAAGWALEPFEPIRFRAEVLN